MRISQRSRSLATVCLSQLVPGLFLCAVLVIAPALARSASFSGTAPKPALESPAQHTRTQQSQMHSLLLVRLHVATACSLNTDPVEEATPVICTRDTAWTTDISSNDYLQRLIVEF